MEAEQGCRVVSGGAYVCYYFSSQVTIYKLLNGSAGRDACLALLGEFQVSIRFNLFSPHGFFFDAILVPPSYPLLQTLMLLHCVVLYFTVLNYTYTSGLASRLVKRTWDLFFDGVDVDAAGADNGVVRRAKPLIHSLTKL